MSDNIWKRIWWILSNGINYEYTTAQCDPEYPHASQPSIEWKLVCVVPRVETEYCDRGYVLSQATVFASVWERKFRTKSFYYE